MNFRYQNKDLVTHSEIGAQAIFSFNVVKIATWFLWLYDHHNPNQLGQMGMQHFFPVHVVKITTWSLWLYDLHSPDKVKWECPINQKGYAQDELLSKLWAH